MKNNYQPNRIAILFLGLGLLQASCSEKSAQKAPPPDIQVINVIQKDVPIYREFVGQTYGLLDIPIRARVEGFLENISFEEGRSVKKGQKLYTIDSQPFLAEVAAQKSKVAEAQTYLVNAENELARYKPLAEINAVSKSDLDAAQASRDAAAASLEAAKANLELSMINLGYCTIKSPIDGLIGKTEARVGEFVGREPNPVILNVVSKIESVRIQFFLTESDYIILAKELAVNNPNEGVDEAEARQKDNFELILADGTIYEEKGTFDFVDRNVDATTGTILIQATFPNSHRILRPGMFAKVRVKMETLDNAILVPQRCVQELQGQYSVFVVEAQNMVNAKQVHAAQRIGDLWLITEGLSATDKVVIEGLQKIASGMEINPIQGEFKSQTNE
jgi:membrane fusion protein (multidrug efflux system)